MYNCFDMPDLLVSTAHAITTVISNVKLWLNYRTIIKLFVPLRNKILQYMCKLEDQDLRSASTRTMAGNYLFSFHQCIVKLCIRVCYLNNQLLMIF